MKYFKRNDESKPFQYLRLVVYGLSIIGYLSYLAYLLYNLITDKPILKVERDFLDHIYVPGKINYK